MFFETRQEHLENVVNEIYNSKLYKYPHVDFILGKEMNGKYHYTAGVSEKLDPAKAYLFRPKAKIKSIPIQNIRYDKLKYREVFEECIEGYVLQQIQKGYEIIFMSIPFHIALWEFVDAYYFDIELFGNGVIRYFQFCHETGISSTLLTNYTYTSFPDFIYDFLNVITNESMYALFKNAIADNLEIMQLLAIKNEIYHDIITRGNKHEKAS